MEIQLQCQNQEIDKLNNNNPSGINDLLIAIQQFVQQLDDQSEKITADENKFQDRLIVQGNENISTIIQKAHEKFSQEKKELEQTLYHRAQCFSYFLDIYITHI